ncbi:MAG: hypothetical protein IPM51_13325 [Sphingobacteriaceae bacterium]|nr:hypothetical protein [Sphingobacteriaceae bacterium]
MSDSLTLILPIIILLALWELTWKLIAMWKAGRNNQLGWFICLALINTAGILPIIYLVMQKNASRAPIQDNY